MNYEFNPLIAVSLFAILILALTIWLLATDDGPKKVGLPLDMDAEKCLKAFRQNVVEAKKKSKKKKRKPKKK
jgi:hypothetical protein